jgi:hypothetical protein
MTIANEIAFPKKSGQVVAIAFIKKEDYPSFP